MAIRCTKRRGTLVVRCRQSRRRGHAKIHVGISTKEPLMSLPFWERIEIREALARRDIAAVFKSLQKVGVSQRRIADATGQSQSEISEVRSGRRIVSYDVLVRIADGLGVPRGHMGLAFDPGTARMIGDQASPPKKADRPIKADPPPTFKPPRRTMPRWWVGEPPNDED